MARQRNPSFPSPEPLSRRGFLKLAGAGAAIGAGGPWLRPAGYLRQSTLAFPAAQNIALAQLHLHATTNHNANYLSNHLASIQWHSWMARNAPGMAPYHAVWWSEHRHAYDQSTDFFIRLETGAINPDTWALEGMLPFDVANSYLRQMAERGCCDHAPAAGAAPPDHDHPDEAIDPRYYAHTMLPTVTGDAAALSCALPGNDFWEIRLTNPQTSGVTTVEYKPVSDPPKSRELGSFFLPRPVFSEVSLQLDCYRTSESDGQRVEIEVLLSDHVREGNGQYNSHAILFVLVWYDQVNGPIVTADKTQMKIQVNLPQGGDWQEGWHTLTLPITQYARMLISESEEGIDNAIQQIFFRVKAPTGTNMTFGMRRPTLISSIPSDQSNWEKSKAISEGYQRMGHRSFSGCEVGNLRSGTHTNAYLPTSAGNAIPPLDMGSDQIAAWAAGLGGLASLNHPFGAYNGDPLPPPQQDQRTRDLAASLLAQDVLGCSLLEVGYVVRGNVDFEYHVKLWDYLLTNDRLTYGLGNHDMHGEVWTWDRMAGCFGNYIYYGGELTQDSLLEGLEAGRVYFGNPWQLDGALDLSLNGVRMGGAAVVAPGSRFNLVITLPEWANHPEWIVTLKVFAITFPDPQTADPRSAARSFTNPIPGLPLRMPRAFDLYFRLEVQLNDHADYWQRTPVAWSNPLWVRRS